MFISNSQSYDRNIASWQYFLQLAGNLVITQAQFHQVQVQGLPMGDTKVEFQQMKVVQTHQVVQVLQMEGHLAEIFQLVVFPQLQGRLVEGIQVV